MRLIKVYVLGLTCMGYGQLDITPDTNAFSLVDHLLGPLTEVYGSPVLVSSDESAGFFTGGDGAFTNGEGFDSGIILSTGDVSDAVGPNESRSTSTSLDVNGFDTAFLETPDGSTLLDRILVDQGRANTTNDASSLTFQFESSQTADLKFNYIFASEEYNEFVNLGFNDIFAFVITLDADPNNDVHDAGERINLAVLPGTDPDPLSSGTPGVNSGVITDGTEVSIDTVNNDLNSESYVDNDSLGSDPPFATENHEYDGRTVSLSATLDDLPAGIHEITLIIADSGDSIYDSAVFIEEGTFFIVPHSTISAGLSSAIEANGAAVFNDLNSRLLRARASYDVLRSKTPNGIERENLNPSGNWRDARQQYGKRFRVMAPANAYSTTIPEFVGTSVIVPEYEFNLLGGTVGLEYDLSRSINIGAGFINNRGDLDLGVYESARIENNAYAVYLSSFNQLSQNTYFYADAMYGLLAGSVSTKRDLEEIGTASGDSDLTGKFIDLNLGVEFHAHDFTHGPTVRLRHSEQSMGSISESGFDNINFPGLEESYASIDTESTTLRTGYQLNFHNYTDVGTVTLQGRIAYQTELVTDERVIDGVSFSPDESALIGGIGFLWNFQTGAFLAADYEGAFADRRDTHNFYVRAEFSF